MKTKVVIHPFMELLNRKWGLGLKALAYQADEGEWAVIHILSPFHKILGAKGRYWHEAAVHVARRQGNEGHHPTSHRCVSSLFPIRKLVHGEPVTQEMVEKLMRDGIGDIRTVHDP